jgi:hypothetical protein
MSKHVSHYSYPSTISFIYKAINATAIAPTSNSNAEPIFWAPAVTWTGDGVVVVVVFDNAVTEGAGVAWVTALEELA